MAEATGGVRAGAGTRVAEAIEAGAVAGVIGGVAMVLFLVTFMVATGRFALEPLQLFGGTFYGPRALSPAAGFGPVIWGLALHLAVAAALGIVFSLVVSGDADPIVVTTSGIVYGLLAWLLLTFLVLPFVDPMMSRSLADFPFAWFAAHVPYGATLALASQFREALSARERARQRA